MITEITAASTFLATYLPPATTPSLRAHFQSSLLKLMQQKFAQHWDTNTPMKGNGYRAVGVLGGRMDSLLLAAAKDVGLSDDVLSNAFPNELVLWVDPGNVAYRVGDRGFPITVWEAKGVTTVTKRSPVTVTIKAPPPSSTSTTEKRHNTVQYTAPANPVSVSQAILVS